MRPSRGEVWYAELEPVRDHEQGGIRPVVVVSADVMNHGPGSLVVILPITRTFRPLPAHVPVRRPEGGLREDSYVLCDQIRSVAISRLHRRLGRFSDVTLQRITDPLRVLLDL